MCEWKLGSVYQLNSESTTPQYGGKVLSAVGLTAMLAGVEKK